MDKSNDKKNFINKLYLDPIENINHKIIKPKGFKIKEDTSKEPEKEKVLNSLPNLNPQQIMGSVIIQNWETTNNIPEDIVGDLIHYPVIMDRKKYKFKETEGGSLPALDQKNQDFSLAKIKKKGELLIQLANAKDKSSTQNIAPSNYMPSQSTNIPQFTRTTNDYALSENSKRLLTITGREDTKYPVALTEPNAVTIASNVQTKKEPKSKLIDFTTFNKHLYLRDNDFLYAKKVGGPVDFVLCTYQDINPKSKIIPANTQALSGRKKLPSLGKKSKNVDYITISKNTVIFYQKGNSSVYSIQEWIDNYAKYKQLMKISLFKNFRNAKLFDLWRRFYKKTKRQYYTEKLKKKLFFIDTDLLSGILEIRQLLKGMKNLNIFDLQQSSPVLLNQFNELHRMNLVETDRKIETYRSKVKILLNSSCNKSYQQYKLLKKITLDDNNNADENENKKNNKKEDAGSNIHNFIKDSIPYAQDATRKTHYKKLLRYIRVMDYVFNETKFDLINHSLDLLSRKFKRLYECYINKWVDPPILITKILCMGDKIYFNPSIRLMTEAIFDNFIQETIYCVIYKKNFIDPQEFPKYMSCFEEVFEVSVDQNSNLNSRVKESECITEKFVMIKENFDLCYEKLNEAVENLRPILENYIKNSKINFTELEQTATPTQLKDLFVEFHEKDKIIRAIRPSINIGIFEFQLDDLLDKVSGAPKVWIEKIRKVIPNVLIAKVKQTIERLNNHLTELSVNPTDIESFIRLKKAVESCNKEKQLHEEVNNDILDLQNIIDLNKEIKIPEFDTKFIIELKDLNVRYDRKLDATVYFIDNNIQNFRLDLKKEIEAFDNNIKEMMSELNNETLNTYNEDSFAAIDFLEENSLQIKKRIGMKEKYQQQEDDLELDEVLKSNFENLDNLIYEQELKVNLWNSVKEFQDQSNEWEKDKVIDINLEEMKKLIKKWLDLCKVALVDLDSPEVPTQLQKKVEVYNQLVPVIEAIKNPNINSVPQLLAILMDLLRTETKFEDPSFTCYKVKNLPDIFSRIGEIEELNNRANEEKRLKDLIKNAGDNFHTRKVPIRINYVKKEIDREFEFVEENLKMLNKVYLNKYVGCVIKNLETLTTEFQKYYRFLTYYVYYQKYLLRMDGVMESAEFAKEMQTEHKKLLNENNKRNNFMKIIKDNITIQKFIDDHSLEKSALEKCLATINSIIQSYEQNYKAIFTFFDKKRKEIPKLNLLSNDDINEIYQERESSEVKQKMIYKIYTWIKYIKISEDADETLHLTTTCGEELQVKYNKSSQTMKDLIEFLDVFLIKKLKDIFKTFKKEYEGSQKAKSEKKPRDVINDLIKGKDNLAQGIFNCMYYYIMDSIDKSLFTADEAFDKLFDLYNEIKDDKIVSFMNMIKENETTMVQKRVLVNLISLLNYSKTIIENLIREDVTSNNDYSFCKLINPKIENDSFMLHFLGYTLEYGYEYVGFQDNFLIMPESERMYIAFANCVTYKRPFQMYGLAESGKKEIFKIFANLCGKRLIYVNTTKNFDLSSFNKYFYGNVKNGCWICIDETQNIKFELLEILATRIADIYRLIQAGNDDEYVEDGERTSININQFSIFLYRDLQFNYPFEQDSIPKIIKNYYRHLALPKIDYYYYIYNTFVNLYLVKCEEYTQKILYVLKYLSCRLDIFKGKHIQMIFITKMIEYFYENLMVINDKNTNLDLFLRSLFMNIFFKVMNDNEKEEFIKFLNEIFEMKDHVEDTTAQENQDDPTVIEMTKKELSSVQITNVNYEQKVKFLYESLKSKISSFVIVGPSITGKTTLIELICEIAKKLNEKDKLKYSKIFNVKLFPKSNTPDIIFAENNVERAYRTNNNIFYDMISLFDAENEENLIRLNEHYHKIMGYEKPEAEEEMTPEKLKKLFKKDDDDYGGDEEGIMYQRQREGVKEKEIKLLVLDGQIDDTWVEYINNIYDSDNFLELTNGDRINFNDEYKLIFETNNLKNTPPSFLTRQVIISCDYETFSWEAILYSWIESNPKLTENTTLKNYTRGLFENYCPRVHDFVIHNNIKSITLSQNYTIKALINIFDSILPQFDFVDIKIGRRNLGVAPKIEIIKKCTLSIFIFSCAWTMNLLSNFVIKTKIEKVIGDVFKADDLKGPIFDYYIDEVTNDFELWSNLLKNYELTFDKNAKFTCGNLFVQTNETIPYTWLCDKFLNINLPFYFNGKASGGKSMLLNYVLDRKSDDELDLLKIKMNASYHTVPTDVEDCIFNNLSTIRRDLYGDKFLKESCLFIDDLNMDVQKDKYGTSNLLEFLRGIISLQCIYDLKNNENRYLQKFNICCCGNLSAYPNDDEFNRFLNKFLLMTFVTTDDFYLNIFKPSLEFQFRKFIPNTSGITASQYLQASIKLSNLLKKEVHQEPKKLHCQINMKDFVRVIQTFHDFNFTGSSDYPDYLKKIFFYENNLLYESKFNKKEDIQMFRNKICEAYSSVFKQDKTTPDMIFDSKWDTDDTYIFSLNYDNFVEITNDDEEKKEEIKEDDTEKEKGYIFLKDKRTLKEYIESKINVYYRAKDISDKTYIKDTNENLDLVIKLLRVLQNNSPNLILVGKELTFKKPLFDLAAYISGVDVVEIDNSYYGDTTKSKESFIKNIILPFLVNVTHKDKKSVLYISSTVKKDYIFETINKLIDKKEIPVNFIFRNEEEYGTITEEETYARLNKNLGICFDLVPKSRNYLKLFINYQYISKNSNIIYFHSWKNKDMTSYLDIAIKEINMEPEIKTKLPELFIDIYNFTGKIYENYYKKTGIQLQLGQNHFSDVCEFYGSKYNEYKTILLEKQRKYNEAIEIIDKAKIIIENCNKEIEQGSPGIAELDKKINEKKKILGEKTAEKNEWRRKKTAEEQSETAVKKKQAEKKAILENALFPFQEAINKATKDLNKINQADLTEIKNTWDALNFGKYLWQKIYEILGEANNEWDNIKKTLDIKLLKNFIAISPVKNKDKLLAIVKEITSSPDFSSGDNKYQKPYKVCGTLCDYFAACNNYFNQLEKQTQLINEIEELKNQMETHNKTAKEYIQQATAVDNEITEIEKGISDLDSKKQNINNHLLKYKALCDCLKDFSNVASKKVSIFKNKKESVDLIVENFDFYLMVLSSYIIYAAPLSNNLRKQYKSYLYSLASKLDIKNIKELEIYSILLKVLDYTKDNEFFSSIGNYSGFLADNFTMMYVMSNKIPYLIDNNRMSSDIISTFLELKNPKVILKATYNDINETGDMFEKLESSMKNGCILFIDQCEENIYSILENLITNKFSYNAEKGKNCYLIKNKKMEKSDRFKLYLIKSKLNSKIPKKAFKNLYVINFTCPLPVIKDSIFNSLCEMQDLQTYQQKNRTQNDINKDTYKLLDYEKKILNYNKQFDLTGNLDRLDHNQNILSKYGIEAASHTNILNQITRNQKRIEISRIILQRFEKISEQGAQIYKILSKFFSYDNLYTLPIDYIESLVKEFYKSKFGIYSEVIQNKKFLKKTNDDDENEEEEVVEEEEQKDDTGAAEAGLTEEEKENREEERQLEEELKKQKQLLNVYPTYKEEDYFEFVIFVYNKISQIYDIEKRRDLLLMILFYGLKLKEEIPANFKEIIYNINKIYFCNEIEKNDNDVKSPLTIITDENWNKIKKINDASAYIFSIILDHIESHSEEWNKFLDDDTVLVERNFEVFDEDLASTMNPFSKFLFFSIVKTHLGDSLITKIISDVLQSQEVSMLDENGETKIKKYELKKSENIEELFFENLNKTRKPILVFDKEDGNLLTQREIKEFYLPKLVNIINENNAKTEGGGNIEAISQKEIIPTKIELTNNELDIIHSAMKNGGMVCIRNCQLIKESLSKIFDEINDKNTVINDYFKLILFVNSNNLLPSYLYSSCFIVNRDLSILGQMKDYLIDLIKSTPMDLFNKFMNCEVNNTSAYYMKKLYVYFTVIYVILIQYSCLKSNIYKIPIDYCRKDYFSLLQFLNKFILSCSEDKQKELNNLDNNYGFTYESLIKIVYDVFINSRLLTKEDLENVNDFLTQFYENSFFMKEDCLFAYDNFIILNIDEKKYPVNQQINITDEIENDNENNNANNNTNSNQNKQYLIPKHALVDEFKAIPNEMYYEVMYGISKKMIEEKSEKKIKQFYSVISKGHDKEIKEDETHEIMINEDKIPKVDFNTIYERLTELKQNLPDLLNTTDANQVLFKINKYNELFNPLDEILQLEIDHYNNFIGKLEGDINSILSVLKGEKILIDYYYEILESINNNKVPRNWLLSKNKDMDFDEWMKKIKNQYDFFTKWILDGYSNCYDLSAMHNDKLFLNLLPIYFQRKLPENTTSSDRIQLHFKLTKYDYNDEITDEIMEEFKKTNDKKNTILIKGLNLKGFDSFKEEDRDIKTFKENLDNKNGVLLPVVIVTYSIEEYQLNENALILNPSKANTTTNTTKKVVKEESEDEDDDEDEEEYVEEKAEDKDKRKEEEKIEEKKGEDKKEEDKRKEENQNTLTAEEGIDKKGDEEKTEKRDSVIFEGSVTKKECTLIRRTRVRYYKKHCRKEVPFVEEFDSRVYSINEPYGYIELRFALEKDKQEEYLNNRDIRIVVDK